MSCFLPILTASLLVFPVLQAHAQGPDVPVYPEGRGARPNGKIAALVKAAKEQGALLAWPQVEAQMQRKSCTLDLPMPRTQKLESRDLWKVARAAHVRVGWYYLCTKCERWHLDLAGGYAITADGAIATCAHVVQKREEMREGFLVAATDDDKLLVVTELLAFSHATDTAILRVKADAPLAPLPLGTDAFPGDAVWCFSDPEGKRGFYSQGIVSRFVKRPFLRRSEVQGGEIKPEDLPRPTWIETTTDWAPGSSGSAIIDAFGNAVGHVSEIQSMLEEPRPARGKAGGAKDKPQPLGTTIIFHQGIAAQNVLDLVRRPGGSVSAR